MAAKRTPKTTKDRRAKKTPTVTTLARTEERPATPPPSTELDRMFDLVHHRFANAFGFEPFGRSPFWDLGHPLLQEGIRPAFSDLEDNGKEFVIRSDLPGVKKEDVKISVNGSRVEISAESASQARSGEGPGTVYRERFQGRFFRAFHLPEDVDSEHAEATFEDGVVVLKLPKRNPTSTDPRSIRIR